MTFLLFSCNSSKHDKESVRAITGDPSRTSMIDTTKEDINEIIDVSIKSGFYDKEDIFANVEDYLYEISFDHDWVRQQIDNAYVDRKKEQSTWPSVTDFDKLVQAFDELNAIGIVALHNAGMTKQDGEGEVIEVYKELLKKGIKTKGFCYYHWQDVERAVYDSHLFIGFGDFNNNEQDALEIGKLVATTIGSKGFKINWDETAKARIEITNIKWQKRFGNDNCDNEKAVILLSNQKN